MGLGNYTKEEEEISIISNSRPNTLYIHEFEEGRFFQVVHEDEFGFEIRFAPRTVLKIVYIKEKEDIEGFELIKLINNNETQKVKLNKFNFAQLRLFLSFISEIDLKGITEKRLKIFDELELDEPTIKTLKTLLSKKGGAEIIETLIDEGIINSKDIVNTNFRKRGLQIFNNMISDVQYWKTYAYDNAISSYSEEKVWQYFLEKNEWIFGYGLDYRFNCIIQSEAHISETNLGGANSVITDFLIANRRFTTFVELKTPNTLLFKDIKNRSRTWKLSNELLEAYSQILEQKASGLINSKKFDKFGNNINQKSIDPKVILIIGNWKEINNCKDEEKSIKEETFELFRRDSRNIEILTYDELYERAKFIVEGKTNEPILK